MNRELSWLEFNQRVLDEAADERTPVLERLKFLAITASNLDEFMMVRVGGLQMLASKRPGARDPSGLTPGEQLAAISDRTHRMVRGQYQCYLQELEPRLAAAGIRRIDKPDLTDDQLDYLEAFFEREIWPVLTPMPVGAGVEFPLLVDQSLSACVHLEHESGAEDGPRLAIIPFGRSTPRFITLPSDGGYRYVLLEDTVQLFADRFFPGETVRSFVPFRISRNADLSVQEDMASDLLAGMEQVLDERKESDCVRLEIADDASDEVRDFLQQSLGAADESVYSVAGPLDLAAFMQIARLHGFAHLREEDWPPLPSPEVDPTESMFDILARRDLLLCHPFDSFEPVVRLIEEAADDPDVLAIKQVLYRTSRRSPIVAALQRAAEQGKYVTALVELKARFDEARNIEWARDLERAAVQVIYGVRGLKTHAKVCVIVRREPRGIRRYVHYGTGNYNEVTARLYTDVSLMSSSDDLGADATTFFNLISGYSQMQPFRKIHMAPSGLRQRLLELIDSERQRCRQGQQAHIMAKFNSLADPAIIDALYEASQAGVRIELNVRGICCLRPGVPGLSENISVVSIVDRFLEHSRVYWFRHGGDELVYVSSADCMPRNLDRRRELLVPVEDPAAPSSPTEDTPSQKAAATRRHRSCSTARRGGVSTMRSDRAGWSSIRTAPRKTRKRLSTPVR
ncbi:MAG: polyphosphate kinase 1 [Planctomycetota bacterium]